MYCIITGYISVRLIICYEKTNLANYTKCKFCINQGSEIDRKGMDAGTATSLAVYAEGGTYLILPFCPLLLFHWLLCPDLAHAECYSAGFTRFSNRTDSAESIQSGVMNGHASFSAMSLCLMGLSATFANSIRR